VAERQRGELFAPRAKERIVADHKPACSQLEQGSKDRIEVAFSPRMQDMELEPEGAGRRLQVSRLCLGGGSVRINERSNDVRRRGQLVQQLQRFDPSSTPNTVTPVRLPPGRLRLVTSLTSTGSNPIMKTIGIVVVVAFAAGAEGLPIAAITDT